MTVAVGSCTSPGRARATNQDFLGHFGGVDHASGMGRLFVLADGMGGEAAGDVASRLAVEVIAREYFARPSDEPGTALERSVMAANEAIHAHAAATEGLQGMGTTCTALVLRGARAWIAHVGDSRAYRLRDGRLERLTTDHSLAHRGPAYAHVLTRALGVRPAVEIDLVPVPAAVAGDVFLLCSDGLWGQVSDEDLAALLGADDDLQAASERMVDMANARGGPDNISVILARLEGVDDASWARAFTGGIGRAWRRLTRRATP
jgi:PPM family protein phosphatase